MSLYGATITTLLERSADPRAAAEVLSGPLDVNVIFTDLLPTRAALNAAVLMARDLGGCLRLRAALVVPFRMPLDQSPVSVQFIERLMRELISEVQEDGLGASAHVYLCRDRVTTLLRILCPNSLIVIGGRKRLWPDRESRMAARLQAAGHRVVFIPFRKREFGPVRSQESSSNGN